MDREGPLGRSPIIKRSVVIHGHKTSVSLEREFWEELKAMAATRQIALCTLLNEIDTARTSGNLSSSLRIYVLKKFMSRTDL